MSCSHFACLCVANGERQLIFLSEMFRKVAEIIKNEQGKKGKGRERGEKGEGGKKY